MGVVFTVMLSFLKKPWLSFRRQIRNKTSGKTPLLLTLNPLEQEGCKQETAVFEYRRWSSWAEMAMGYLYSR